MIPGVVCGYSRYPNVIAVCPLAAITLLIHYGTGLVFMDGTHGHIKGRQTMGVLVTSPMGTLAHTHAHTRAHTHTHTQIIHTRVCMHKCVLSHVTDSDPSGTRLLAASGILQNHDEASYVCWLNALYDATAKRWEPTEVMVDFEVAIHNTVQRVWPKAHLRGCLFHHQQCLRRKLKGSVLPPSADTAHSSRYTHTARCTQRAYTAHCTQRPTQRTTHSAQHTAHRTQAPLSAPHTALHTVHHTAHNALHTILRTQRTTHCLL